MPEAPADDRIGAKEAARRASREAMLDAAVRMLLDAPSADPLAVLRPRDVAERAVPARTTGAFYNIWPTQAEFRRDVLGRLLDVGRFQVGERTSRVLAELLAAGDFDRDTVARLAANMNSDALSKHSLMGLKLALWTLAPRDDEVRLFLRELYTEVDAGMIPLYEDLLRLSGRRLTQGYDVAFFATALSALAEGLHLRRVVDAAAVPDEAAAPPGAVTGVGERWSMFATLAHVLLMGMTEPDPDAGDHPHDR